MNRRRVCVAVAMATAVIVVVAWGFVWFAWRAVPCQRGHHETATVLIPVGKVLVPIPQDRFVCDEQGAP